METLLDILAILLLIWTAIKLVDLIIELFPLFGGDGVQPYDVMWWICRPISMRGMALFRLPMLIGLVVWIALWYGTFWAFERFF